MVRKKKIVCFSRVHGIIKREFRKRSYDIAAISIFYNMRRSRNMAKQYKEGGCNFLKKESTRARSLCLNLS